MNMRASIFCFAFVFSVLTITATKKEDCQTKQAANLSEILSNIAAQLEGQDVTQANYLEQINTLFSSTDQNSSDIESNSTDIESNSTDISTNSTDIDAIAVELNEIITALNDSAGFSLEEFVLPSDS